MIMMVIAAAAAAPPFQHHDDSDDDDDADTTSLMTQATWNGNATTVAHLLAHDPALANVHDSYHRTPLIMAATRGYVEVARLLLATEGVAVDAGDSRGYTALDWACTLGHSKIASMLLRHGADVRIRGSYGETPLISAASNGHIEIVRLLLLSWPADGGGSLVDEKDKLGFTALASACECAHHDVARVLLLEGGADHRIKNRRGRDAKQVAMNRGHRECVKLMEWFEMELERPYHLHRARYIYEAQSLRQHFPHPPTPLPLLHDDHHHHHHHHHQGSDDHDHHHNHQAAPSLLLIPRPATRLVTSRSSSPEEKEDEEEERAAVMSFIIQDLSRELFRELLEGLQLRGRYLEKEDGCEGTGERGRGKKGCCEGGREGASRGRNKQGAASCCQLL